MDNPARAPGAARRQERMPPDVSLFVASVNAHNLYLIARFLRLSTAMPGEIEWLFNRISTAIAGRAIKIPAEAGAKFADFIEFLAAQVAQQDHLNGVD